MPASTRHHRALAVFVHCLGILAAVPALPTAAPKAEAAPPAVATPSAVAAPSVVAAPSAVAAPPAVAAPSAAGAPASPAPAAPPAVAPTAAAPARAVKPPVTVAVAPASTPAPAYRIQVRNDSNAPVDTTVRQELPPGSSATTITSGGRAMPSAGRSAATEVTWRLKLPARSTTTLNTALTATAPGRPVTAPACAFAPDGSRPYDCGTATWSGGPVRAAKVTEAPAWRRTPVLLAALAAVLVLTGCGLWLWQRQRRRRTGGAPDGFAPGLAGTPVAAGGAGGPAGLGTVYPRPATPRTAGRRRTPPVWMLVAVAAAILAGVLVAVAWTATQRVAAIDTQSQPTSGAWVGQTASGAVGVPLREVALEFTVYRINCGAAAGVGRQCLATVGVRNVTPEQQTWHGQLQRAYLPGGRFVSADETATRAANLGRDVFAQPLAAGSRVVLPLVFTVDGGQPPKQLELRSGVFSAGVRVDVP